MAIDWLESLEQRVREAASEIGRLRQENSRLEDRCEDLETQLETAQAASEEGGWEQERIEIRERVERLAESLAGLLEE